MELLPLNVTGEHKIIIIKASIHYWYKESVGDLSCDTGKVAEHFIFSSLGQQQLAPGLPHFRFGQSTAK